MASADKVQILCRHGGDFIRESNQVRYEGGKNRIVLVDQDINYFNLSIKVCEKCKLTDITSIQYKYPGRDLDSLVSIEEDDDVSVMMKAFSQSNMVIDLFVSGSQNSSTLVATSEPVVHAPMDLNGSNGIVVLSRHAIESNTGSVQNIQNDLHEMECNEVDDLQNLDNGPIGTVLMDFDEGRNTGMSFPDISNFNKGNGFHEVVAGYLLNSNNGPIGVASEGLNGNKETSIHITDLDMGDVPHGSYENECNEMDNAVSSPCVKVDRGANDIKEGQEFENQTAFRKALRNHAICSKFEYKRTRSGHGVFRARCLKPSCSWSITACKTSAKDTFKIKSLKGNHTCNASERSRKHKHVTEKWIADFVTDRKFVRHNPNDIVRAIDREYGIEVSYHKARRGKILAEKHAALEQSIPGIQTVLKGIERTNPGIQTVLKGIERTNPGSTAKLSCSSDKSLRIFVAYEASIYGFLHGCRPVLALNYRMIDRIGVLWMYAAAADAAGDTFPVASAFVQSKCTKNWKWAFVQPMCTENWKWFGEELARILKGKISELIFLPDPREGILEVVRDFFPDSHHRYLVEQLMLYIAGDLDRDAAFFLARDAGLAVTQNEFNAKVVALRDKSKAASKFIEGIEPKHWAMCHYEGNYLLMNYLELNWRLNICWSLFAEGIVPSLKRFHASIMEMFNDRAEKSRLWNPNMGEKERRLLNRRVKCSCGNWFQSNCFRESLCPCKQRIWDEEGKWFTAAKYMETYSQQICPLPDETTLFETAST